MATEYESLRLSVSLTDNVTAQLQKIRGSLANLGGGAAGSGMEKLKRQMTELGERTKGLTGMFGASSESALGMAKSIGIAGVGVAAFGVAINRSLDALGKYAEGMEGLAKIARQTGLATAQIEETTKAYRRSGMTAEQALADMAGIADAMGAINKKNSEVAQSLLKGQVGAQREAAQALVNDLRRLSTDQVGFTDRVRQAYTEVYEESLKAGKSTTEAARAANNYLKEFNAINLGGLRAETKRATEEQQAMMDARIKQAQEYNTVVSEIGIAWDEVKQSTASALIPIATEALKPVAQFFRESSEQITAAVEAWRKFEAPAWMKQVGADLKAIDDAISGALNSMNAGASALGKTTREIIDNFKPPEWLLKFIEMAGAADAKIREVGDSTRARQSRVVEERQAEYDRQVAARDARAAPSQAPPAAQTAAGPMGMGGRGGGTDAAFAAPKTSLWGKAKGLVGRAAGGPLDAGQMSIVGEQGPELFAPSQSGNIVPNQILRAALGKMMHGAGAIDAMKKDAQKPGHPLRTTLRSILGLSDPQEPAPWQAGGQWRRQTGGPVTAGSKGLVGEAGPELFMPSGGSGGGEGKRLIAEQTHQMQELVQNTENQSTQTRALTEEIAMLNRHLEAAGGGGGGGGGGRGGPGAGGGGGLRMGGLGGLPGFGGGRGGGAGGGGGSSGGGGASGSWEASTTPSGQADDMAASTSPRAGQAGTGSGKAAAEAYLGKKISDGEYDSLMRATHAESGSKNSPEEQAMIMGSILNRAREHKGGISGALNAPNQFQAVTGTRFDPGPSRNYRQGPNETRAASIEGAAQDLLHRVPTSQKNFTAASRAAYGPGTNVGYLDQMKRTGGAVHGGTQFGTSLLPKLGGEAAMANLGGGHYPGDGHDHSHEGGEFVPLSGGGAVNQKQAGTRNLAIKEELRRQLSAAAKATGVEVDVFSGGQPKIGTSNKRVGSTRHDEGNAADIKLRDPETGRILDMRNKNDQMRMAKFTQEAVAQGATGVGAGMGYMGASSLHIGGGTKASWGGADWVGGAHKRGLAEQEERRRNAKTGSGPASIASLDADMDRSMTQTVRGEGKLSVDVRAPAGTKVAAEGSGLFKQVETNRMVQMQEAAEGPSTAV